MAVAARVLFLLYVTSAYAVGQGFTLTDVPKDFAQRGPSGSSVSWLLRMNAVQESIGLDQGQRHELRIRLTEWSRHRQTFFRNLLDGKVFADPLSPGEVRSILDLYNDYHEKSLLSVLSDAQLQQLGQIVIQLHHAHAPQSHEVASESPRPVELAVGSVRRGVGGEYSSYRTHGTRANSTTQLANSSRNRGHFHRTLGVSQRRPSSTVKRLPSTGAIRKSSGSSVARYFFVSPRYHLDSESP